MFFYCFFLSSSLVMILSFFPCHIDAPSPSLTKDEIQKYRNKVLEMFYHAYDGYLKYASKYDELQPISCQGMDTWGSFSLSLIDALDTLAVIGNFSEFRRVADVVVNTIDFNVNINVSVFETNIRVIGGLLSAHLLSHKAGYVKEPGWPCSGPLLRLAEDAARKLLPAFETETGMPYGTVNLMYGVPENETPITCTAGVGTFILEFFTLSILTGDPIFQEKALRAIMALQDARSKINLLGNHINVQDGKWTATEFGIGAGIDSYLEYLVKGSMLLQMPKFMEMFYEYYHAVNKYVKKDDWFVWVGMTSGTPTMPVFQSLEAFWPGVLSLIGKNDEAKKSLYNYHQIWKQYGFVPEFYDIPNAKVTSKREGYPLRPEFIESVMYLHRATKDPHLLQIGADVVDSIYHSAKTECGYATVKDVEDHTIEDRMESFFLAETLKYLYLLFDEDNFIHNDGSSGTVINTTSGQCVIDAGGYIFNTEAHPIDVSALYCCSPQKAFEDTVMAKFEDNLDLYNMFSLSDIPDSSLDIFKKKHNNEVTQEMTHDELYTQDLNEKQHSQGDDTDSASKKEPELSSDHTVILEMKNNHKKNIESKSILDELLESINDVLGDSSYDVDNTESVKPKPSLSTSSSVTPTQEQVEMSPVKDDSFQPTIESSHDVNAIPQVSKTPDIFIQSTTSFDAGKVGFEQKEKDFVFSDNKINVDKQSESQDETMETTIRVEGTSISPEGMHSSIPVPTLEGWHEKSRDVQGLSEEVEAIISASPLLKQNKVLMQLLLDKFDKNNEGKSDILGKLDHSLPLTPPSSSESNMNMTKPSSSYYSLINATSLSLSNFDLLLCPSQHFLSRLSLFGQMIVTSFDSN